MADLKQTFILRCLKEYNERVIAAMRRELQRLKVNDTGEGERSLAFEVFKSSADGAYSTLSFNEYLRMVDMGVGRGYPLGGLKSMSVELQASKKRGIGYVNKRRKVKKIYASIAYGNLSTLTGKLLYGLTDEVIAQLKQELEQKNTTT